MLKHSLRVVGRGMHLRFALALAAALKIVSRHLPSGLDLSQQELASARALEPNSATVAGQSQGSRSDPVPAACAPCPTGLRPAPSVLRWASIVGISLMTFQASAQSAPSSLGRELTQGVGFQTPLVLGKVKAIDRNLGRIILAHGPIESFGMPAMTMSFWISDRTQLVGLAVGDSIEFKVRKANGVFIIADVVKR